MCSNCLNISESIAAIVASECLTVKKVVIS